jgi:hypothetical protein
LTPALRIQVSGSYVHGRLADVLHPVRHGLFWFTGMAPLQPFAVYGTVDVSDERFGSAQRAYGRRLDGLFTEQPSTSTQTPERAGQFAEPVATPAAGSPRAPLDESPLFCSAAL